MKYSLKILAALSSLIVLTGSIMPTSAFAARSSVPDIASENVSLPANDAAAQIREYLKARSAEFTNPIRQRQFTSRGKILISMVLNISQH